MGCAGSDIIDNIENSEVNRKIEKCVIAEYDLDQWIGKYYFSEGCSDPVPMAMEQNIVIYFENGKYYADVEICGQTTLARVKGKVCGDEDWISIVCLETLPDDVNWWGETGDVMFSLEKKDDVIYTYWGVVLPMLSEHYSSGKVYFEKKVE